MFEMDKFVKKAELACQAGFNVYAHIWSNPEIVAFFAQLPSDDNITRFLSGLIESQTNKQGRVLIVGGASGRLGRHVAAANPGLDVWEIDSSPQMTLLAQGLAAEAKLDNFHTVLGDAMVIPFDRQAVDLVISQGFLRHFKYLTEVERLVDEMKRVGKLVLVAEANTGGDVVNYLAQGYEVEVSAREMKMKRVSLFIYLYDQYKRNPEFRSLVDSQLASDGKYLDQISGLAGESLGILHYFLM